jgi:hypothetical protein
MSGIQIPTVPDDLKPVLNEPAQKIPNGSMLFDYWPGIKMV